MTGTATLVLPWYKPVLTSNDSFGSRAGMFKKARLIREIREAVVVLARHHRLPRDVAHVVVTLHYVPAVNRTRDTINLAPMVKACVDGLLPNKVNKTQKGFQVYPGYGMIPDDNPEYVTTPEVVIHPVEKPGKMWLNLEWTTKA